MTGTVVTKYLHIPLDVITIDDMLPEKISVAVICTGNSCRSQMAEGFIRTFGGDKVDVHSAGSEPEKEVAPFAVEVMNEIGIDISSHVPKSISSIEEKKFDYVISVCDDASRFCPVFSGNVEEPVVLHWPLEDPHGRGIEAYREVRKKLNGLITIWLSNEPGILSNHMEKA